MSKRGTGLSEKKLSFIFSFAFAETLRELAALDKFSFPQKLYSNSYALMNFQVRNLIEGLMNYISTNHPRLLGLKGELSIKDSVKLNKTVLYLSIVPIHFFSKFHLLQNQSFPPEC